MNKTPRSKDIKLDDNMMNSSSNLGKDAFHLELEEEAATREKFED